MTEAEKERLTEILSDAAETATRLSLWEEEFLDQLRERVALYGERTRVSEKQWGVLNRIEAKLYGA